MLNFTKQHMNLVCIVAIFSFAALLTAFFPQSDLIVSGWFYQPSQGFWHSAFLQEVHRFFPYALVAASAVAGVFLLQQKKITPKEASFIISSFILGPGLIINGVLKEYYGRARPLQIEQFGGHAHFTSALTIADQCYHNCSFTSGDPSVGFAMIAFALVLPKQAKRITGLALSMGLALGLMRIAQGGHFLSDVLFTAVVSMGCVLLLYKAFFRNEPIKLA
jgi:lipid A 4'-phosphatase